MTISVRPDRQVVFPAAELPVQEVAFRAVAALRAHPHVNNVLTHISRGDWAAIERALRRILDPQKADGELSLLEQNLVELMGAGRGVTGRILGPYFREFAGRLLHADQAEWVVAHVRSLLARLQQSATADALGQTTTAGSPSE